MEMPKVTQKHESLYVFAGEWIGAEKMHAGPMGPGGGDFARCIADSMTVEPEKKGKRGTNWNNCLTPAKAGV